LLPQDLTILNEEQSFKMEEVSAIIFVKNTESDKPKGDSEDESQFSDSLDIQQQLVGLMYINGDLSKYGDGGRLIISIRKISNLNEPLFTIKLSEDECVELRW